MAQLSCELESRRLPSRPDLTITELVVEGFIDASTTLAFERVLERAATQDARHLIVDFSKVQYINSSGISALLRTQEIYSRRGGILCLVGVPEQVGLSMHLLGVTRLIPFRSTINEAVETVLRAEKEGIEAVLPASRAPAVDTSRRAAVRRMRARQRASDGPRRRVLVIAPDQTRFTNVLQRRFTQYARSDYYILSDATEALRSYDSILPDLVVVDDRCDPDGEMVSRMKVQANRSLTSIIKTYRRETDVEARVDFKIWENDFLIDPFEVGDFFALTEAELDRVPKDRRVFHQQVRFEFRTTHENVEKAHALVDRILRDALRRDDERTTFFAAVKEGIDNAVRHGNHSRPEKRVDVNCLVDQKKITMIIEDEGEGFDHAWYLARVAGHDAFEDAKRRIVSDGIRGGLGILLMSRCADRLEYSGAGNAVRLEKNR